VTVTARGRAYLCQAPKRISTSVWPPPASALPTKPYSRAATTIMVVNKKRIGTTPTTKTQIDHNQVTTQNLMLLLRETPKIHTVDKIRIPLTTTQLDHLNIQHLMLLLRKKMKNHMLDKIRIPLTTTQLDHLNIQHLMPLLKKTTKNHMVVTKIKMRIDQKRSNTTMQTILKREVMKIHMAEKIRKTSIDKEIATARIRTRKITTIFKKTIHTILNGNKRKMTQKTTLTHHSTNMSMLLIMPPHGALTKHLETTHSGKVMLQEQIKLSLLSIHQRVNPLH